ncbi:CgeB family protein [Paenibacillus senegalensis]|uniref:CgeB family protein n=1 Tax=Paenibacillus senegalensis TaxID=1465766 RepID=UPI00028801D8|nr:glycosyltransferase [Paenibacillus senegalensis]
MSKNRILMCYGKTKFSPGSYLEDGLNEIGWHVDQLSGEIDFRQLNMSKYTAVLFVESSSRPPVKVKNIEQVKVPKLFWVTHGENRLQTNLMLNRSYKTDIVLMAHSLHLADKFPVPVRFFPFAMTVDIFNYTDPLVQRTTDISFIGNLDTTNYLDRIMAIKAIKTRFHDKCSLSFRSNVYLHELAKVYGRSKIVINVTADWSSSINMRLFEGMGCGALVLSDYVPGMEQLFEDKKHLVLFQNRDELLDHIDYYLNNLDQAQKIANAGYQHLLANHTYRHRARELVNIIDALQ